MEIDIVVLDDVSRRARLIEVKRNPAKLDMADLERRSADLEHELEGYEVTLQGLSMEDVRTDRAHHGARGDRTVPSGSRRLRVGAGA